MVDNTPSKSLSGRLGKQAHHFNIAKQIAMELGVDPSKLDQFCQSVQQIEDNDQVVLSSASAASLPPPGRHMIGKFRLNQRGFGFVIPDSPTEHGDLFVPAGNTTGALTGDHVRAQVLRRKPREGGTGNARGKRSPYHGRIIEILQRANSQYTGNLIKQKSRWIVQVDGKLLHDPVIIRDPHAKNAKAGDKVIVELIDYPTNGEAPEGVIVEVIGESGQLHIETAAIIHTYGLPESFPEAVLGEARTLSQGFDSKAIPSNRTDETNRLVCTIDPPDARDFDDGISVDRLNPSVESDGASFELGVHIADVSHFVTPGSKLDQEAHKRGTSAYLPRKVIPMLPELLSNGVCSLQEGVNRYCKSAFLRYDEHGNVLHQRFARTVVCSSKRLTYLEAQALIDGDLKEARKHAKTETKYPRHLTPTLKCLNELAKTIQNRRFKAGMIVLDLPEVELIFNDDGQVVDATPSDSAFTHTLIEMFMVEANEAVARLFATLSLPAIRRIHPDPDSQDLQDLRQFTRIAGHNIPQKPNRTELQALLNSVRGKPVQHAIHMAVLKTLSKAEYSPRMIGHFALASDHYTHFTSPIRRYPDLLIHRALEAYIDLAVKPSVTNNTQGLHQIKQQLENDSRVLSEPDLLEAGRHCSATERNAEAAERDLRTFMVLDLLSHHTGDQFDGTVTGVTSTGIFIQIDRYLADGFISISDLASFYPGNDRWKLNRTTGAMVAQKSGKTITLGNRFRVLIAKVDPPSRKLELVIHSDLTTTQKNSKIRGDTTARNRRPNTKRAINKRKKKK